MAGSVAEPKARCDECDEILTQCSLCAMLYFISFIWEGCPQKSLNNQKWTGVVAEF